MEGEERPVVLSTKRALSIAPAFQSAHLIAMGQLLIPDLDDTMMEVLRQRALAHGLSIEDEARRILAAAVSLAREEALAGLDASRQTIGRLDGASALNDLRLDRARDG
jgi:plasmid stability protein